MEILSKQREDTKKSQYSTHHGLFPSAREQ